MSSGFDAVSSFFGSETQIKEVHRLNDETHRKSSSVGRRSGVGVKTKDVGVEVEKVDSFQTKNKILAIGKKRKMDDDSDDGDLVKDDDSSDEEGGRTSVVKEKKTISSSVVIEKEFQMRPKKKKKNGKKERKVEKDIETKISVDHQTMDYSSKLLNDVGYEEKQVDFVADDSKIAHQKKKRRKIRSKQKNVRKDTRSSSDKPEHLRIGSKNYAGRALTSETREHLHLPESRTSHIRKERSSGNFHVSVESKDSDIHLGLAVDDLLTDDQIIDSGEIVGNSQEIKPQKIRVSKQKHKKKSKFKNLK